jgi:exopolysaccharide biosynthesis polyprenyl glycosylphosphotransferase
VRRLLFTFAGLLVLCSVGAWILAQPIRPLEIVLHLMPVALAILLSMYVVEMVGVTERALPPLNVESLFWAVATSCIVMAIGYSVIPTYAPSTQLVCAAPVAATLCVYLHRKWVEFRGRGKGKVVAALFAGSRSDALSGMAELAQTPEIGVKVVVLPEEERDRSPLAGLPVLTPLESSERVEEEGIHLFVVANARDEDLRGVLASCAGSGCIIDGVHELVAKMHGQVHLGTGDAVALLGRITNRASRFTFQRALDLLIVALVAAPAAVLGLLVALAVRLTSPGPALYRQTRVGRWNREFGILKFRTMRVDAENMTGPVWAQKNDPRVTPVGRVLRRTRLDELPQLWNVLVGDMSIVGPRPERPAFVASLREEIPFYDARHAVRPGLTGWAQVRYQYGGSVEDARTKLSYELFYIFNRSLTFYCTVLLETVKVLVFQRGGR